MINRQIRVEHSQNAIKQALLPPATCSARRVAYDDVPWFWSDQYDTNLQYAGIHTTVGGAPWSEGASTPAVIWRCYVNDGRGRRG